LKCAMHLLCGRRCPPTQGHRLALNGQADVPTCATEGQKRKARLEVADSTQRFESTLVPRVRGRRGGDDVPRTAGAAPCRKGAVRAPRQSVCFVEHNNVP